MGCLPKIVRRPVIRASDGSARDGSGVWESHEPSGLLATSIASFSATAAYQTADGEGIRGHASGFWVASMFIVDTAATLGYASMCGLVGSRGWSMRVDVTTGKVVFRVCNGVGTPVDSPVTTAPTADGRTINVCLGFFSGAGALVELYCNGMRVGTGTACVGVTVANATDKLHVGRRGTGASPLPGKWLATAGGDGDYPDDSEALQYFADVKAAKTLVSMAGVTTEYIWRADNGPPSEIVETLGTGENLDIVSTLTVAKTPYVWAY